MIGTAKLEKTVDLNICGYHGTDISLLPYHANCSNTFHLLFLSSSFPSPLQLVCPGNICTVKQKLLHFAAIVITFCVKKIITFYVDVLLHFALSKLLHFAAIVITFCVSITFCSDYFALVLHFAA